jgi:hypothetical protein
MLRGSPNRDGEKEVVGMPVKANFTCRNCEALCRLVREEAGPESRDRQVTCLACGEPFPGREGKFILKYFLLAKATLIQESRLRWRTSTSKFWMSSAVGISAAAV